MKIRINDPVMFENVLGNWEKAEVIGINKASYRLIASRFRVLSIPKSKVVSMDLYRRMEELDQKGAC